MDFHDLVTRARTCRRFYEQEGLPKDFLEWVVDCARLSPCAMNAQALRFAIAETAPTCASLFPALKMAGAIPNGGPGEGEHPAGYVVILGEKGERARYNAIDMGIAAQTMHLAAMSRGVGCCMIMVFDPRIVTEVLAIPEPWEPLIILAFGMPKEIRHIAPMPADGSTKYWRNEKNEHFVPKRTLEDILLIKK